MPSKQYTFLFLYFLHAKPSIEICYKHHTATLGKIHVLVGEFVINTKQKKPINNFSTPRQYPLFLHIL